MVNHQKLHAAASLHFDPISWPFCNRRGAQQILFLFAATLHVFEDYFVTLSDFFSRIVKKEKKFGSYMVVDHIF